VLHGRESIFGKAHEKARISMSDGRPGAVDLCSLATNTVFDQQEIRESGGRA
jgi:hypothetical protein